MLMFRGDCSNTGNIDKVEQSKPSSDPEEITASEQYNYPVLLSNTCLFGFFTLKEGSRNTNSCPLQFESDSELRHCCSFPSRSPENKDRHLNGYQGMFFLPWVSTLFPDSSSGHLIVHALWHSCHDCIIKWRCHVLHTKSSLQSICKD